MRWFLAMALLAASSYYLFRQYTRMALPPPAPPTQPAAPPVKPPSFLTPEELKRVRASTKHYDPGVRSTALELLYTLGDPDAITYLEQAVAKDPDPAVRLKAVQLLGSKAGGPRAHALVTALKDPEKEIRLAALKGLEEAGDAGAAPWIARAASKDYDPEVRAEALRVLGDLQDKRRRDFEQLATQLRQQYEQAVERSRERQQ